jgi:hypothetical protein
MEWITVLSIIATAAATVAIAFYTRKTHNLMEAVKQKDSEHQQEIKDLFQAIVISNILSAGKPQGGQLLDGLFSEFEKRYKGKTPIRIKG